MAGGPRIQEARRRTASAKRTLAVVSLTGFLAAFVLARVSHPGHAAQPASSSRAPAPAATSDDEGSTFDFGSGSIAPSQSVAPRVQSSTS